MAKAPDDEFVVDFLTMWIVPDWIERHCVMPTTLHEPAPMRMYDWQLWCTVNHYRVKPGALAAGASRASGKQVSPASAFAYRRSQIVAVQKVGKGPWSASIICVEAVGPVVFCGFAEGGETYACVDHGCSCGWRYVYPRGEPMGRPWTRPLIQILATSEEQTDNIYGPLQTMIRAGSLNDQMRVGEGFIRLPNDGRIDRVTAKAQSKLGNPITFAMQDETGLYTKSNGLVGVAQTQRRGAAGMGGRSMETTNPWDPAENSTAQQTYEARAADVFRFYRIPPAHLSYRNAKDRRQIHRFNYRGTDHVDLESIEAEAAELIETDPEQAERFYGGRLVQGLGGWLKPGLWASREVEPQVSDKFRWEDRAQPPVGTAVCGGFDGSESDDWTAIRLRTLDGYRFTPTYGPDRRPTCWNPVEWGGSIPRGEVTAAWDEICTRYRLKRAYCDPRDWQSEIGDWAQRWGTDVFLEWATYRTVQMHEALTRSVSDLISGRATHDGCPLTTTHVANARKVAKPGERYLIAKPHGAYHQKIDMAMADVLAWEAGEDARASGWGAPKATNYLYTA